jgi:hypothetical protein
VFVPRTSSTTVATWFWQTEGRSAERVILGVRPSEFIFLELRSPSRRIFIGSQSPPSGSSYQSFTWLAAPAVREAKRTPRTWIPRMRYVMSSLLCARRMKSWLTCLIIVITFLDRLRSLGRSIELCLKMLGLEWLS